MRKTFRLITTQYILPTAGCGDFPRCNAQTLAITCVVFVFLTGLVSITNSKAGASVSISSFPIQFLWVRISFAANSTCPPATKNSK
jgi:hypothetical protein